MLLALIIIEMMCMPANFISSSNATAISKPVPAWERTTNDLPDDSSRNQIHVMYVLPSDGVDESLDTSGTLARSVATFQRWLAGQSGDQLRLDTYGGVLDITFFRLSQTDAQIASYGAFVRDQIESELISAGFNRPNKIYAVYYGGGSTFACGGGAWPPDLPGIVAALYLKGAPPEAPACSTTPLASSEDRPGYLEFAMLHEILHTIGIVATCAPHHTLRGHVSDNPNDLMYAGSLPWQPSVLDIGHDDYFRHNNASCLDLAISPFMTSNSTLLLREPNTNRLRDKLSMTWVLLAVILVALIAAGCLSFRGKGVSTKSVSSFTPNPMNEKIILVKGWNDIEIRKIINDFIETYKGDGYPTYAIEPHRQEENMFRLTFPKDIHPTLFTFLVNYLAYPVDLDFKNRSVIVGGKTTLSPEFDGVDSALVGKRAVLYVPQDDQDHDVVYMQTESGINLANSFTEMKWKKVSDARLSSDVRNLTDGF